MSSPELPSSLDSRNLWLKLLHYQPVFGGYESTIDNSEFFIHPNGKFDPELEREATIAAMKNARKVVGAQGEIDVICAFPARYMFLKNEIDRSPPDCDGVSHWLKRLELNSMSLVFASGYEKNPASLFGHVFLKLNLDERKGYEYLNYSVSFAADTESQQC